MSFWGLGLLIVLLGVFVWFIAPGENGTLLGTPTWHETGHFLIGFGTGFAAAGIACPSRRIF